MNGSRRAVAFRRALSACCGSGAGLVELLESTALTHRLDRRIATLLIDIASGVRSGERLSAALARTDALVEHELALVRLGERTGRLPDALASVAEGAQRDLDRRRGRRARLASAVGTVLVLWGVLVLLALTAVPNFGELASVFPPEALPPSAVIALALARQSRATAVVLLLAPLLLAAGRAVARYRIVARWRRRSSPNRRVPERVVLREWPRFALATALAIRAGTPLPEARVRARGTVSDARLRHALRHAARKSPHDLDSLLAPVPVPALAIPSPEPPDVSRDLERASEEVSKRYGVLVEIRDQRLAAGIFALAALGTFAAVWLLLVPYLELAGRDPF